MPLFEENNKKERYITQEEAARLYAALQQSESEMLQYIVPMLILTGARKREVLDARWSDFDLSKRLWRIAISKSGKARHVPLSEGVIKLLERVPRFDGCVWVFPNPKTSAPFVTIFRSWDTTRVRAGLPEVRIHDLRHSFASFLINNGRNLYEVQKILGHTQVRTTQRYAHLSQETLLDAVNTAVNALGDAFMPASGGAQDLGRSPAAGPCVTSRQSSRSRQLLGKPSRAPGMAGLAANSEESLRPQPELGEMTLNKAWIRTIWA